MITLPACARLPSSHLPSLTHSLSLSLSYSFFLSFSSTRLAHSLSLSCALLSFSHSHAFATLLCHSRARVTSCLPPSRSVSFHNYAPRARAPVRALCPRAYQNCTTATRSLASAAPSLSILSISLGLVLPSVLSAEHRYIMGQWHCRHTHTPRLSRKSAEVARAIFVNVPFPSTREKIGRAHV